MSPILLLSRSQASCKRPVSALKAEQASLTDPFSAPVHPARLRRGTHCLAASVQEAGSTPLPTTSQHSCLQHTSK